jgi:hypothetical protein
VSESIDQHNVLRLVSNSAEDTAASYRSRDEDCGAEISRNCDQRTH